MANRTITGLGATATSLSGAELMEVVQGGISKQATTQLVANLAALAYAATSTTSLAISVAQKSLTTQSSLAYVAGSRVRVASTANPTVDYMEGEVSSYSSTTMVVEVDRIGGSGTLASWNISLAGDVGNTGTVAIGTVTTGAAGSSASVTNSGTTTAAILDFTIPRGDAGAGSGDVVGPASSTNNSLARFDGTTGKLLKDGAVIGTDVQAYDATLTSLAALGTAADKLAYTTGIDTWAEAAITAFARTLLDDANAAAALATIGAQASDAELTAIAGLTSAADKGIQFTGAGTAATYDLTSAGKALLDDASAADQRTTLGLAIGTDVQAYDATLASLAALGTAADKVAYTTGIDTWAEAAITAFGRSILDDADAATARTSLGLVIGTDVQAYDADLASWASVTRASGFDTFAATPSSANLAALLSDETGTGANVHATSPTLVTPVLGVATATSVNKLAITAPATGSTLAVADGKTLTASNTLTLAGTDGTTLTFPSVSSTMMAAGAYSFVIDASQMIPRTTNGCAALATYESTTNKVNIDYLAFDPTTQEFCQFKISKMPKSWNESTITAVPIWAHPATTTNFGTVWGVSALALSNDDAIDTAFGTAQTSTDTGGTTADVYHGPATSAVTIGNTPAEGDTVIFQVSRNPADGSDTMAVDGWLVGIEITITTNAANDA